METSVVIVGIGETGDLAYQYFLKDSEYEVVGFAVEKDYLTLKTKYGLPVIDLAQIFNEYPPGQVKIFVTISYTKLNRIRERIFEKLLFMGYEFASYISSRAFVWDTAKIGRNCFILENNVIQHGVAIEDNVILWSGNHIGHQSIIRKSAYLSSHVVVSGFCEIGARSFLGVNSTIVDGVKIADECLVGAAACVTKHTIKQGIYTGNPAILRPGISSLRYFRVGSQDD